MANKPNTYFWLTGDKGIHVEMSAEDVKGALAAGSPLAQLPTGEGTYEYVNPAHVIRARESADDAGPMVDFG